MAFCKSLSVYLFGGPGTEAGAEARVGARACIGVAVETQETMDVGTRVLLSLVKTPPALQRMWGPAIWTGWIDYFYSFKQAGWPVGFGAFRIIIGLTQYYTTKMNWKGDV